MENKETSRECSYPAPIVPEITGIQKRLQKLCEEASGNAQVRNCSNREYQNKHIMSTYHGIKWMSLQWNFCDFSFYHILCLFYRIYMFVLLNWDWANLLQCVKPVLNHAKGHTLKNCLPKQNNCLVNYDFNKSYFK